MLRWQITTQLPSQIPYITEILWKDLTMRNLCLTEASALPCTIHRLWALLLQVWRTYRGSEHQRLMPTTRLERLPPTQGTLEGKDLQLMYPSGVTGSGMIGQVVWLAAGEEEAVST